MGNHQITKEGAAGGEAFEWSRQTLHVRAHIFEMLRKMLFCSPSSVFQLGAFFFFFFFFSTGPLYTAESGSCVIPLTTDGAIK